MTFSHRSLPDRPTGNDQGALVRRPRLYEVGSAVRFLGRRRSVYDELVAQSGIQPGDHVLDIGCGTGYFTRRAAVAVGPVGRVIGIDPSRPQIDHATRLAPDNCTFQLAGAQALPYPDGSFDAVISSVAIHHVPPDDRPKAMSEACRVLRPGGRLLIAEFRRRPLHTRILSHVGAHRLAATAHNPVEQLDHLIGQAGFDVTGSGTCGPWFRYVQARRLQSAPAAS